MLSLYFSLIPATNTVPLLWNDKLVHCLSYFLLMMMLDFSWQSGENMMVKGCLIFVYSSIIEYGQSFVPGRDMSIGDIAANSTGILLFIFIVPALKKMSAYRKLRLE